MTATCYFCENRGVYIHLDIGDGSCALCEERKKVRRLGKPTEWPCFNCQTMLNVDYCFIVDEDNRAVNLGDVIGLHICPDCHPKDDESGGSIIVVG